jgi:hypothetical protein
MDDVASDVVQHKSGLIRLGQRTTPSKSRLLRTSTGSGHHLTFSLVSARHERVKLILAMSDLKM